MEDIEDWIKKLSEEDIAIIVEGKNDEKALRKLGLENPVYQLSRKPMFEIMEDVSSEHSEVLILTDFDKKGKQYYGVIKKSLQKLGVKIDHRFREWLQKNSKLSHIEGLDTYRNHGSVLHKLCK